MYKIIVLYTRERILGATTPSQILFLVWKQDIKGITILIKKVCPKIKKCILDFGAKSYFVNRSLVSCPANIIQKRLQGTDSVLFLNHSGCRGGPQFIIHFTRTFFGGFLIKYMYILIFIVESYCENYCLRIIYHIVYVFYYIVIEQLQQSGVYPSV